MTEKRLTKLDRMTDAQKNAEVSKYWAAPEEATFTQETLALVYCRSIAWFQMKRCTGNGIKFSKAIGTRSILYCKRDARAYFEVTPVESTSALSASA
jgi:hypothetical protein